MAGQEGVPKGHNLSSSQGVQHAGEDEELVRKAVRGDADAFGALVERHQGAVAGFLMGMLRDPDAAEDLAQEAFVKAFKAIGAFEGRSSFKTWVTQIALNEARSRLRRQKLRRWLSLESPGEDDGRRLEETLRDELSDGRERSALERRLELDGAMQCLAPREREVASLRLEGYSLGETAQALGVSVGTVKSTLFSATRKMREKLS